MSWLRRIWLLMLVLGTVVSPRLASAQAPLGLETRVGGLDLAAQVIIGVHGLASAGSYLGNPDGYDENASGCSLAARGGGQLLPTLGNLGDDAVGVVAGTLSRNQGGYRVAGKVAEGSYDFVVQGGRIVVGRGHAALSGGGRVTYAGEITFRGGQIVEWTNASGHFRPAAAFAGNAGLPMESFRAVQFPSMVGGSQLPVFQ
ncbi:MAG: hypothetical protein JW751_01970 [Polyangiaceae bacterium]|nr:hypothetical protein [Polyangiaceae bacterium]